MDDNFVNQKSIYICIIMTYLKQAVLLNITIILIKVKHFVIMALEPNWRIILLQSRCWSTCWL